MKTCLITGCNGHIGSYLTKAMIDKDLAVYGVIHTNTHRISSLGRKMKLLECDIMDKERVEEMVTNLKPDLVFHLAAQSRVVPSWEDPERTFQVNVLGTIHLLNAIRKAGGKPKVVVVTAAAIYGSTTDKIPIKEESPLRTSSPYAISKFAQDSLAELYWRAYSMRVIRVRPFNITGPGMIGDVCSDFSKGIVEIEAGLKQNLKVGNLSAVRDITDVRDAVKCFWLLAEKGLPGRIYNLSSGVGHRIADVLDQLVSVSKKRITVVTDDSITRTIEDHFQIGDNSKLRALGWKPTIPLEKTLSDMMEHWRSFYRESGHRL